MSFSLRLATTADYPAIADIHNHIVPEHPMTVDDLLHEDSVRPDYCFIERWVAEQDDLVVATGAFFHIVVMYHPRKFWLYVDVHPEYRRQGIGSQLYAKLVERAAAHDPLVLRTEYRDDWEAGKAFATKLGYTEEMRTWESHLDVQSFDATRFAGAEEKAAAHEIEIITLSEYMQRVPDYQRALYEPLVAIRRDVPSQDPYTPPPFEEWIKRFLDPHQLPDGFLLALHNGEVVGTSQLYSSTDPKILHTGLTAVRKEYRRMGIALAMKLRAIAFAKAYGAAEITTGNESNNIPMLSINEALGFVKKPAWVSVAKVIKVEEEALPATAEPALA